MKSKIAIVRGKFLNKYEMQFYEPLISEFDVTAFGSLSPFHDSFAFPVVKLPCPMDLPEFPYKQPILNRLFTDSHYLFGLEEKLQGFDLVHSAETYYRYTQQALDAKKKGYVKKVIATVLENIPFNNEGIEGRKEYKARARKELDHMIALTKKTRDALLAEGADPKKITVISHYIDTTRFVQGSHMSHATGHKSIRILCCGRLEDYKGVFDILEAARMLVHDPALKTFPFSFVFVGDGSQKERMIQTEKKYGIESIVDHVHVLYNDMPSMYQKADIYIAPTKGNATWHEQYNTTLLEAQASGLPIVTTTDGGIPENVGDAALLVSPGDAPALAQALKRFIISSKLRDEYGKRARKRAETVHDIHIGAKKLSDVYHELLS